MHADATFDSGTADCIDQSRLANACLTTHDNGATVSARHASIERRENHRKFGTTAHERLRRYARVSADGVQ
jgi:hypothetical protein